MKLFSKIFLISAIILAAVINLVGVKTASAIDVMSDACKQNPDSAVCRSRANPKENAVSMTKTIINTMLYILGTVAVIMIVIGGFRFLTSNGDPSKVKAGKDTILYSVIGLVVAILSYAIVAFVTTRLK